MQNDKFKLITSVYLLLMRDSKIYLQKRKGTGFRDGQWGLVAGHHDGGESLRYAMIREAKEEADIDIAESDLEFVHILHKKENDERLEVFFSCKIWKGKPRIAEPHKVEDVGWFEVDDLPERTIDYIEYVIKKVDEGMYYSEYGFEHSMELE